MRRAPAELVAAHREQHVLPADYAVGGLGRQELAQEVGDRVARRQRDDVAGRALKHRHVLGVPRHRRDERDRSRAAADHHHSLARVVEVLGPVLGVDDLPAEALGALEFRGERLVVAIVARAHEEEVARELHGLAVVLGLHRPARLLGRPLRSHHLVPEPDRRLDVVLARGLTDVAEDVGAVGDRLRLPPRLERVAEREHVGVRADARVAEEVPGAADGVAGLEDGKGLLGQLGAQVAGGADAREAGADDQDIDVFGGHSEQVTPM